MTKRAPFTRTKLPDGSESWSVTFERWKAVLALVVAIVGVPGSVWLGSRWLIAPVLAAAIREEMRTEHDWNREEHARVAADVERSLAKDTATMDKWRETMLASMARLEQRVDALTVRR
jgi:cytochrome c-type biogenesis protein CcmH/NrfG